MSTFNLDLSCVSLNARGLRDNIKRKSIFMFCKSTKASCILLQETHSIETDERFWLNQWGDKILFSHGSNKSAGVAFLFNNFLGKILTSKRDDCGHLIFCVVELEKSLFILGNVYGYHNPNLNKTLLSEISETVKILVQDTQLLVLSSEEISIWFRMNT